MVSAIYAMNTDWKSHVDVALPILMAAGVLIVFLVKVLADFFTRKEREIILYKDCEAVCELEFKL